MEVRSIEYDRLMWEIVQIPVADLLLDNANPRLSTDQPDQQRTLLELIHDREDHVLNLAEDIVEQGSLDPTAPIVVVATADRRKRYKVIEGNRRVLALKALETPSLISVKLNEKQRRRLSGLSRRYAFCPLDEITCVLFDTEEEADHWILLRHTGQNEGRGLVSWGAVEQDRYNSRRHGVRKPAGQVLEFVEKHGNLSAEARASSRGVLTNIERLLGTPEARQHLGVDVVRGQVIALYPLEELVKSLTRIVEDAKSGDVTVPQLYHVQDRVNYVMSLPRTTLPKKSKRLSHPVVLDDLTEGKAKPRSASKPKPKPRRKAKQRTTVIPEHASLNVTPPRINAIYNELSELTAEQCPNACSVLLRVFIELGVDHYIDEHRLMAEAIARNKPLAYRLKKVTGHLQETGRIPSKLRKAIDQIADGPTILAPGISTFNQYVHNSYLFPRTRDLYLAWDELAPLMEALWP
jgi:hypothetical protein